MKAGSEISTALALTSLGFPSPTATICLVHSTSAKHVSYPASCSLIYSIGIIGRTSDSGSVLVTCFFYSRVAEERSCAPSETQHKPPVAFSVSHCLWSLAAPAISQFCGTSRRFPMTSLSKMRFCCGISLADRLY